MTAPDIKKTWRELLQPQIDAALSLVSHILTQEQQVAMLKRPADAASWADAKPNDAAQLTAVAWIISAVSKTRQSIPDIQKWLAEPIEDLGQLTPQQILSGDWKPADSNVQALLVVAEKLSGDPDRAASCNHCKPSNPTPA